MKRPFKPKDLGCLFIPKAKRKRKWYREAMFLTAILDGGDRGRFLVFQEGFTFPHIPEEWSFKKVKKTK
jgi:hypothetical protein